jgi:hypothetical protein
MMALCGLCHDDCGIGRVDKDSQWRYKAKLKRPEYFEAAAEAGADEVELKTKRARDVETLTALFSELHTVITDRFLYEASAGYVLYDFATHFWEGFNAIVSSATFYLYDETAWQMIRDFHNSVSIMLSFSEWMSFTGPKDKLKWDERYIAESGWRTDYQTFKEQFFLADSAYRKLYAYVREKYVEIDIKKTDAAAWDDFKRYRAMLKDE